MNFVRPSTPNTVLYDTDMDATSNILVSRPGTSKSLVPPPPAMMYHSPPDTARDVGLLAGGNPQSRGIWTVEGKRERKRERQEKCILTINE